MGFFLKNRINVYEEKTYILHLAARAIGPMRTHTVKMI